MSTLLPVDRDGKNISHAIVKLNEHTFVIQKAMIAKASVAIDDTNTILRSLIGEVINKEKNCVLVKMTTLQK